MLKISRQTIVLGTGYNAIRGYLTKINPDVVLSSRTLYEDKSLGSNLHNSILYNVSHPQPMCTQRLMKQSSNVGKATPTVDQASNQLEWFDMLAESYDLYIDKKYKVPVCVGFFLYGDIAEIA